METPLCFDFISLWIFHLGFLVLASKACCLGSPLFPLQFIGNSCWVIVFFIWVCLEFSWVFQWRLLPLRLLSVRGWSQLACPWRARKTILWDRQCFRLQRDWVVGLNEGYNTAMAVLIISLVAGFHLSTARASTIWWALVSLSSRARLIPAPRDSPHL